jgi:hypothetical protein
MDAEVRSDRFVVNEYLFMEFGLNSDRNPPPISEEWPFRLDEAGTIGSKKFYSFTEDGASYWAFSGRVTGFWPKAEMSFEDLTVQERGRVWIAERDSVDLKTTIIGDDRVPYTWIRKGALELLAQTIPGVEPPILLEGIYLATTACYLALGQRGASNPAFVVGTEVTPFVVGFPEAIPWQRLAYGIGMLLHQGRL